MPDSDAVRRLLEGEIDPVEIEGDEGLYSMAERIYGAEALEEMGVLAPTVIDIDERIDGGMISDDISLPDFVPLLPDMKLGKQKVRTKKRYFTLITGILGILGTLVNNLIGGGYLLCSIGVADYPYVCNPDQGNYKLVIENGYTWDKLHTASAWTQPMEFGAVDIVLVIFFFILIVISMFWPRKSIHPGDITPLGG